MEDWNEGDEQARLLSMLPEVWIKRVTKEEAKRAKSNHTVKMMLPKEYHTNVVRGQYGDAKIRLKPDPCVYGYREFALRGERKEAMEKILRDFIERGWLEPCHSKWASPCFVVLKKVAGEWRLVVNYRGLNVQTQHDRYRLPLIEDMLQKQHRRRIFTVIDLKHGYHPRSRVETLRRLFEGDASSKMPLDLEEVDTGSGGDSSPTAYRRRKGKGKTPGRSRRPAGGHPHDSDPFFTASNRDGRCRRHRRGVAGGGGRDVPMEPEGESEDLPPPYRSS